MARARSKHTSSDGRTKLRAGAKHISRTVETYLERQSKYTSCMVETYLKPVETYFELGRNILCGRSKHISTIAASTTRAWSKKTSRDGRNIPRPTAERFLKRLKHISSTFETKLERSRNSPRARSKQTWSTNETYLEHRRNIYQA